MQEIYNTYKKTCNLHHVYLIEGEKDTLYNDIIVFLNENLDFKTKTNPDFWKEDHDSFGIKEARKIKDIHSKKTLKGNKRFFILGFNSITTEAQNSLLKLFEEPSRGTHFFVITRSSDVLLSTLKSRMVIVKKQPLDFSGENSALKLVKEFLILNKPDRINLLKDIIKEKDKHSSIMFLDELEKEIRNNLDIKKISQKDIFILEEIQRSKKYLNTRSSSIKMILENIALIT